MTGCLKNIPEHMNWWEEFESSHDAPQAPHIDGAGGQSGRIGFLLAPWNSQKKKKKKTLPPETWLNYLTETPETWLNYLTEMWQN